jgi:hypothetical protein
MALGTGSIWDFVLALGATDGDKVVPGGSGFLLTFGLGITAAHTFGEYFESLSARKKNSDPDYYVVAHQLVEKGSYALQWGVRSLFRMPSMAENDSPIDIALVELTPLNPEGDGSFSQYRHRKPILSIAPPAVGTKIKSYGYIESELLPKVVDR